MSLNTYPYARHREAHHFPGNAPFDCPHCTRELRRRAAATDANLPAQDSVPSRRGRARAAALVAVLATITATLAALHFAAAWQHGALINGWTLWFAVAATALIVAAWRAERGERP